MPDDATCRIAAAIITAELISDLYHVALGNDVLDGRAESAGRRTPDAIADAPFERSPDGDAPASSDQNRGTSMGKEARIGLLLASCCCLLAVMVDWVVEELK
jgi:hypothetical protein